MMQTRLYPTTGSSSVAVVDRIQRNDETGVGVEVQMSGDWTTSGFAICPARAHAMRKEVSLRSDNSLVLHGYVPFRYLGGL